MFNKENITFIFLILWLGLALVYFTLWRNNLILLFFIALVPLKTYLEKKLDDE